MNEYYSVFGIRIFFMNEYYSVFGIRKFFMNEYIRYSVFGQIHYSVQLCYSYKQKILILRMTAFYYFVNISVQISPNNKNLDIFKIYMERAIEKCPRWIF